MQDECPDVPIPHLYGFALFKRSMRLSPHASAQKKRANRLSISLPQLSTALFFVSLYHHLRSLFLSWLGRPVPSNLVQHKSGLSNELGGYLLIEYIDQKQGQMLLNTWKTSRTDDRLRKNLFRSLSRTMLRIGRVGFPRIRSFIIDDCQRRVETARRSLRNVEKLGLENDITIQCTMKYKTRDEGRQEGEYSDEILVVPLEWNICPIPASCHLRQRRLIVFCVSDVSWATAFHSVPCPSRSVGRRQIQAVVVDMSARGMHKCMASEIT